MHDMFLDVFVCFRNLGRKTITYFEPRANSESETCVLMQNYWSENFTLLDQTLIWSPSAVNLHDVTESSDNHYRCLRVK